MKHAAETGNGTDWWGASGDLAKIVMKQLQPSDRILQVGCGDSPIAELLYHAGFHNIHSIDINAQVIAAMKLRYPPARWPGFSFEVRDFLDDSEIQPGFTTVLDKA